VSTLTDRTGRIPGGSTWLRMGQPKPPTARELIDQLRGPIAGRWLELEDFDTAWCAWIAEEHLLELGYLLEHRADQESWQRAVKLLSASVVNLHRVLPWDVDTYGRLLRAIHGLGQLDDSGRGL
jgi:hypothetical protein